VSTNKERSRVARSYLRAVLAASISNTSVYTFCIVLTLLLCMLVARNARAAELEWFGKYSHNTDAFRGCPLRCGRDAEPQLDALLGGATLTAGKRKRWEIDIAHGFKSVDRGRLEGSSQLDVRFYPQRNKDVSP
jgi:hypothetical protein